MTTQRFWKHQPAPMWRDLRALSLMVPAIAATLGGIAYSIQGIAVTQSGALPEAWVSAAVSSGAVLLAIGCEGGTLSAMAEIARKRRDGDAGPVDRWAGWVSFLATVFGRLLAITALRSLWAVVLLVVLSAADVYALISEAGEYLALHDRNMQRWLTARFHFEERGDLQGAMAALKGDAVMPAMQPTPIPQERINVAPVTAPATADKSAWLAYAGSLNGKRATVTAQDVEAWLVAQGAGLPSRRTLQGWAQAAREMRS